MGDSDDPAPSGSLTSRRALIRRAAVAGTVAWVAPIVVGSIVSPASASTCTCSTASQYRGAKIEGISPSSGQCPPAGSATTVTGTMGFTSSVNRCGTTCWAATNGSPSTTGTAPTYTCATKTITLPTGCTWGDKGMVAVFLGGQVSSGGGCQGNYFVETTLPSGYACGQGPNSAGTLSAGGTTFNLASVLTSTQLSKISHVNVIYCCC